MHTLARHRDAAPCWAREDGYTIVEIMAAIVIFTIGVLGTMSLLESSFASTSRTTAREQGTNLARDLVERSRQANYVDTTTAKAGTTLRALLPSTDSASAASYSASTGDTTFAVTRRNVRYTVTTTACSIDDPADGAGVGGQIPTVIFCADDTASSSDPGTQPPKPAIGISTVLGIPVSLTAGGNLLDTVCNAAALNSRIGTKVLNLVSPIAPVSACPGAAGGTASYDANPDDMRYLSFTVTWTRGGKAGEVRQTTLIPNPNQT